MDIVKYVSEGAFIMIPVLYIIGAMIKGIEKIPDKFIPLVLLVVGVGGALALLGFSVQSAIQGILVTGVTVYGDQLAKQLCKKDE